MANGTASVKLSKRNKKKLTWKVFKNKLTIWSLIILPSRSIVLIFYKQNNRVTLQNDFNFIEVKKTPQEYRLSATQFKLTDISTHSDILAQSWSI